MELQLFISFVLALSLCLQQLLGTTYGFQCQNRVTVSKSCALKKTTRCTMCWDWRLQIKFLYDWNARGNLSTMTTNIIQSNITWNTETDNKLYNIKSSVYKWNQKLIKTQLDSRVFGLWSRTTFVEQKIKMTEV